MNAQSKFAPAVLYGVLGPICLARHTWPCPCFFVVPEATHAANRGPLKGFVSALKALQGSETELLGRTEENNISRWGIIDLPSHPIKNRKVQRLRDNRNPDVQLQATWSKHMQTKINKRGCFRNYCESVLGLRICNFQKPFSFNFLTECLQANQWFFYKKRKHKKIVLVARPGIPR